jgi:hypothetical protein
MYKKISSDSVNAFLNKQPFNKENMSVVKGSGYDDCRWYLLLHGNVIAKMKHDGSIYISTCGWHTRTTLERLNCLLYTLGSGMRIRTKNYEPYISLSDGTKLPWTDNIMVKYNTYMIWK